MPVLFFIVLVIMGSFAMLLPALIYVLENMGASISAATPVLSAYSLAQFLAGPQWGRLSDRLGRKPVLCMTLLLGAFAYFCISVYADSFFKLLGLMALAGVASGGMAVVFASTADLTTAQNRTRGMGVVGAAIGLAFIIGTAIGGSVAGGSADEASLIMPSTISAIACLIGILGVWALLKEPLQDTSHNGTPNPVTTGRLQAFLRLAEHRTLLKLCLLILAFTSCVALMEPLVPKYINMHFGWGPIEMRNIFIFIGIVLVLVQGGLVGPISKRFGEKNMVRAALVLMAVGLMLLALLPVSWVIYVALLLTSVATACFTAATLSLASTQAEPHEKGTVMGVAQSMQAFGRFLGPLVAGILFDAAYWLPFVAGALIILLLFIAVNRLLSIMAVA